MEKYFDRRLASGTGPEAKRRRFHCVMFYGGIR